MGNHPPNPQPRSGAQAGIVATRWLSAVDWATSEHLQSLVDKTTTPIYALSMRLARQRIGVLTAVVAIGVAVTATRGLGGDLPLDLGRALETSRYVYIATARKGGGYGTPAEIWFMYDRGAVWVASPPTTWRVKRIRAGRPTARIAVGTKDGPSFAATGSLVRDPAVYERLFATYAQKYPEAWPQYESRFREGLKDGSRVLIRYQPVTPLPSVSPGSGTPRPSPAR